MLHQTHRPKLSSWWHTELVVRQGHRTAHHSSGCNRDIATSTPCVKVEPYHTETQQHVIYQDMFPHFPDKLLKVHVLQKSRRRTLHRRRPSYLLFFFWLGCAFIQVRCCRLSGRRGSQRDRELAKC